MDGNFYTETYTYREGRILLYKRPNSKNFQCRLEGGFCIQQSERKAGINFLLVRWRLYLKLYFL